MSMRRAMPIEAVAAYVIEEMKQAEAAYERWRAAYSPVPGARERADWYRYVHRELRRAEENGVGAVLARGLDNQLIEQLCLLGEQLFWQDQIDTVPSTLTELAVRPPFRRDDGTPSADRAAWIRQKIGRGE